jgi:hypothetical protein
VPDQGDWTGFLVGQLTEAQAQRLLIHLLDQPLAQAPVRTALHALAAGSEDPLAALYDDAEALLAIPPSS